MTRSTDLARIRHVALDMDGTIYSGGTLFPFTIPFLNLLGELGIGYTFLTNNSSKSVSDYLLHLENMGVPATAEQIYTSTGSAVDYLRDELPDVNRLFVVGTESLRRELKEAGFVPVEDEPDAVLVGFDTNLSYATLCRAAWWIQKGCPFIATHPDRVCPTDQPTVLIDCGAVCACLESATGVAPTAVLGKPDSRMLAGILRRHNLHPDELAMAGDRIYTDMAMAVRARALGVLVLSGEANAEQARSAVPPPDIVVPTLRELGEKLKEARETLCAPPPAARSAPGDAVPVQP